MTRISLFHPSLRTNDATIIVQCFAFCIFLLLTSISFYLSLEIYRPEIYLVFYAPIFYVTLELLSYFILTKSTF